MGYRVPTQDDLGRVLTWHDLRLALYACVTLPFIVIGYLVGHVAYWASVGYQLAWIHNHEAVSRHPEEVDDGP